jgi:signal transduction histidine kinase
MTVECDHKNIFIRIKDKGIGIPKNDLEKLFTSFSRGSNVGEIQGTGLGLSIVKRAVNLLRGTITVKSNTREGTEFKVKLPLSYA